MSKSRPETVAEIFDALDGPANVARALGVGQSTASEMKRRRSIPVGHWPALMAAAARRGVEIDEASLVRIHVAGAA
jgi:hypothetical protein